MLGLTDINQLTHKIENVFDAARRFPAGRRRHRATDVPEPRPSGAMIGLFGDPDASPVACDELVESIRAGSMRPAPTRSKVPGRNGPAYAKRRQCGRGPTRLPHVAAGEGTATPAPEAGSPQAEDCDAAVAKAATPANNAPLVDPADFEDLLPPDLLQQVTASAPAGRVVLAGLVCFEKNSSLQCLKAELLLEKLSRLGDLCYFFPPPESLEQVEAVPVFTLGW